MKRRDFLKAAGGIGASTLLAAPKKALALSFEGTMNWAGNISFNPKQIESPTSIEELRQIVRDSQSVRVIGAKHSFNDIAACSDVWLDLRDLEVRGAIDTARKTVELPGSMTLAEANDFLDSKGLAFTSIGEIDCQTLAGLAATSTHGTGMKWGTLSDQVLGMKVVTGAGEYRELSSGDELAAARTHLGALGAVVSITYQLGEAHQLERHRRFMPEDEALDPAFIRSNDHTQIYYLPFADKFYVKTLNVTDKKASGLFGKRFDETFKENLMLNAVLKFKSLSPSSIPSLMDFMAKQFEESWDVGPSHVMMTSLRQMRYHEMEFALKFDDLRAAFQAVKSVVQELAGLPNPEDRFYAHLPITLRMVKGCGNNFLSPTLGQDTAYISVTSHTSFTGYEKYFKAVEAVLRPTFGARPHWAKHFYENPRALYPEFGRYLEIRNQLDPQGKFLNPYMDRLLS